MNTICIDQNKTTLNTTANSIASRIFATLTKLAERFVQHLEQRKQRQIDRDAFNHLLDLDESILDDIGVTRFDVIEASKLPLSKNASNELEKVSKQNRYNS